MATVTVPAKIDSSGTLDTTAALNHLFEITPDKTTIAFPTDGRYRLDGTLLLPNRALTLQGDNTVLFGFGKGLNDPTNPTHPGRNRSQLRVTAGTSQVVGMIIKGANPAAGTGDSAYVAALEGQHCIELTDVNSFTLDGSHLSDPYGDMVYMSSAPGTNTCVRLLNTVMIRSGRMAVTINGANAMLMEGCDVSQIRRSTFDYEPTSPTAIASGITLRGNNFGSHRLNFLSAVGGVLGTQGDDWSIETNTSTSPFTIQFAGNADTHRNNFRFVDNLTTGPGYGTPSGALIALKYVDGAEIAGNVCPLQQGRTPPMRIASYTACTGIDEHDNPPV